MRRNDLAGVRPAAPVLRFSGVNERANHLPPASDDAALLEAIAGRSEAALEALYRRHSPAAFAVCLRVLRDRGEAEEALLETFLQVWSRANHYDPLRSAPLTYILTVARTRALDRRRRTRARPTVALPPTSAAMGAAAMPAAAADGDDAGISRGNGPAPLEDMLATERRQIVRAALDRLGETQRQAIQLAFFDGMSQSEVARALGKPLGTVKALIRRGLCAMRDTCRAASEGSDG